MTGRERRWPRAHAPPPPPEHTPGPAAAAYLPRRPASFLCGAQAAAAASCAHGSDAPLTRLQPAGRSRPKLAVSRPAPRRPGRGRCFLQLRSRCSRLLSVRRQLQRLAAGPASCPAPRAPPPSPRQPAPASPPLSAGPAPSASAVHFAGPRARRPAGWSSSPANLSCCRARLPPPAAGMPWAAGPSALALRPPGRPGCCPPAAEPAAGRLRDQRRRVRGRSRTNSDLEAASLIAVS